jgi:hypothetical protein
MTVPPKIYEVGHGRPPKHTRWKKGQTGNPNRIHQRKAKPVVQLIDQFFAAEVTILEEGVRRRITNFKAILLQLATNAVTGNRRALNVFLKYHEFAASRGGGDKGPLWLRETEHGLVEAWPNNG